MGGARPRKVLSLIIMIIIMIMMKMMMMEEVEGVNRMKSCSCGLWTQRKKMKEVEE